MLVPKQKECSILNQTTREIFHSFKKADLFVAIMGNRNWMVIQLVNLFSNPVVARAHEGLG